MYKFNEQQATSNKQHQQQLQLFQLQQQPNVVATKYHHFAAGITITNFLLSLNLSRDFLLEHYFENVPALTAFQLFILSNTNSMIIFVSLFNFLKI